MCYSKDKIINELFCFKLFLLKDKPYQDKNSVVLVSFCYNYDLKKKKKGKLKQLLIQFNAPKIISFKIPLFWFLQD